jgi:tRNA(Ile)-lysidine synthase
MSMDALERVRDGGLLGRDARVVVMLSGGRDSVCLLDLAVQLCVDGVVSALHVNYHLRAAADGDQRHCVDVCERLGVDLEVVHAHRADETGNVQAWARSERYAAAERRAAAIGPDALIATGHTASDQVETILYRLAASPGRRALLGMRPRDGRLVRPLLSLTREQTAAHCSERGLVWVEDESNLDRGYARTRVREGLVRELRAIHPAAEANVLRTAALLGEEADLLDGLIERELGGLGEIGLARLSELPGALARLIVIELAERAAGEYVPQAGAHVGEIIALSERGGRGELHVGGSVSAVLEDGRLRFVKLPPR